MGYRRSVLTRWSHRDKLAILVITVTVAFLTGTTLVLTAAGTQTTTIAEEYDTDGTATYYDSVETATAHASTNALVLPVATVSQPNGSHQYVVGIPPDKAQTFSRRTGITVPSPPAAGVSTSRSSGLPSDTQRLVGTNQSLTVPVTVETDTDSQSSLPPSWYRATPATVNRLGSTGAFVVQPASYNSTPVPATGVPLRAALAFFVAGTQQLLSVVALLALGGAVLVGVVVYSVTRMSVRERIQAIQLIRATGSPPSIVWRLFGVRAGLLTAMGIGIGYAIGVIATRAAVNIAVASGLPTSLSVRVTPQVAQLLLLGYGGLALTGIIAGVGAAWSASRRPPATLRQETTRTPSTSARSSSWIPDFISLTLLDWRALIPSTATLAVFATVVLVGASVAGVLAPLMSTSGTTITEPGAVHPIASKVPSNYASVLQNQGTTASPELLVFTVHNGQSLVVRGVEFDSFAALSGATLTHGRAPRAQNEAVIGADLAQTRDIEVGESITLGGSTATSFTRVKVVGMYTASGIYDDQLLVSLRTGQHLSRAQPGMVHFIRTSEQLNSTPKTQSKVTILDVTVPETVTVTESLPVRIRTQNFGTKATTRTIRVHVGQQVRERTVQLQPHAQRTITLNVSLADVGTQEVTVGNKTATVRVVPQNALQLHGLPASAPPSSSPQVQVTTVTGHPVANATLRIQNRTVTTGHNGTARLSLEAPGTYSLTVTHKNQSVSRTINVSRTATRTPTAQVQIRPNQPSLLVRPTAQISMYNPWQTEISAQIDLTAAGKQYTQRVTLAPGETTTKQIQLTRAAPGSYTARLTTAGQTLDTATYTVTGDERIVTAYANQGGYAGSSGIGRILETAFGNLTFLVGILGVLAGSMTIGSTTAMFAQAIHARRQAIGVHRATGALPRQVTLLILTDALKIGVVATGLALGGALLTTTVLAKSGFLTIFGIQITPMVTLTVIGVVICGELMIILLSALLVALSLLRQQPVALVRAAEQTNNSATNSRGMWNE